MIRKGHLCQSFPTMSPTLNNIISSLQRSGTFINFLIAALTTGGQQLCSSFTFRCPCQAGKNFCYGSAFLVIPALILLVAGYALRSQMWTMSSEYCCSCGPPQRRISPLERKLACLRFFSITGRALIAPLTWLAVTLLTGTYYECAASEFASVDHYPVFDNVSASKRKEVLAGFPCGKSVPSDMILVRDEVGLLHRYQSQMLGWILITLATIAALVSRCVARCCSPLTSLQQCYWTNHLHNERELFEQAAKQHSRLLIMQSIKKLFGFIPGKEDVRHIRIPSCQDWRDISAPNLLCMGEDLQGHYSFLRDRVDENEESKSEGIELKP
ncbi:calcium homeostasis modulator protein 4 [Mirounga leonina]|uniref:calcium homeostasis modulator protein 4 n=1 Tax=Mirounga leonina TaxID=9715 RepID=UPI00156C5B5E|nr:calcium homeostasis modulator protein 4 [Mirounga leonina]